MRKSQANKLNFLHTKFFLFVVVLEVSALIILINNQFFVHYLFFLIAQFVFTTVIALKMQKRLLLETRKSLSNYHKRINEDEQYVYELQAENRQLKSDIKKLEKPGKK